MVLRPGRSRAAATSSLNRLTEIVSVTVMWCGAAPSSGASFAPMRPGDSYHPAAFQERMNYIAKTVPNGNGHVLLLPGLGHVPHLEAPEKVLPPLVTFLKEGLGAK